VDMKTMPAMQQRAQSVGKLDAEALFRAHAPFVASFLQRLGSPRGEVEDLVQEVFLVAHRKGGFVPGSGQPRTWLGAISVHVAQSARRSRRRLEARGTTDSELVELATSPRPDPAQSLETQRALQRVQAALDTLDIEHRAAFVLYELEKESCDSIAAAFDVPVGTIYSRLHHARKRFLEAYSAKEASQRASLRAQQTVEGR